MKRKAKNTETHGKFTTNNTYQHSVHYQSAREAGQSQMYHLCELEYDDIDLVPFAEQITILLFETFNSSVLNFSNSNRPKAGEFNSDRDFANDLLHVAQDVFRVTRWPRECITNKDFGAPVRGKGYEFRRIIRKLRADLTNLASLRALKNLPCARLLLAVPPPRVRKTVIMMEKACQL
ncbi:hypothetical protein KCV00_g365, partial [Aureobasidium melanogenum]